MSDPGIEDEAGQGTASPLACKYYNKSPLVVPSRSVQLCESRGALIFSWDKEHPENSSWSNWKCRSWRHAGDCQRWKGAQDFVRCKEAILSLGPHWVYFVFTLNQKQFKNEWAGYRAGVFLWDKMRKRLTRCYAKIAYLQTWEKNVETDFPHMNVVVHNEKIWELCEGDGFWEFRREWNPIAIACGFGLRFYVEPLRAGMSLDLAGYLTKLSRELTGAGVKNQVPVNAPLHFRRLRASRGLLPPSFHSEGRTGMLIRAKDLHSVDLSVEARIKLQSSLGGRSGRK